MSLVVRKIIPGLICFALLSQPVQNQKAFNNQSERLLSREVVTKISNSHLGGENARPNLELPTETAGAELLSQFGGTCENVAVEGNVVFMNEGNKLIIVDISVPNSPSKLGNPLFFEAGISALSVENNYLYIGTGNNGLHILDVSNPNDPSEISHLAIPGFIWEVTISSHYAYVAANQLFIIDISNPAQPNIDSQWGINIKAVVVSKSYAYAINNSTSLYVIDITNPNDPIGVGYYDSKGILDSFQDVTIFGSYVILANNNGPYYSTSGLKVIDISDPTAPKVVGELYKPTYKLAICGINICALSIDSSLNNELDFVDISNPATPNVIGSFDSSSNLADITVLGNKAFLADKTEGLRIIDISDQISIYRESFLDINTMSAAGLAISGSYLYVQKMVYIDLGFTYGLSVIDVSQPNVPREVGFYNPLSCDIFKISGTYLYMFSNFGNFRIVDISDPTNPVQVYAYNIAGRITDFIISGTLIYAADSDIGFRVFDISDLSAVSEIGDVPFSNASSLAVYGSYSYVIDNNSNLHIIDIENSHAPSEIGNYQLAEPNGTISAIAVSGSYLYVYGMNFHVFDLAQPSSPVDIYDYYLNFSSYGGMSIIGSFAYLSSSSEGIFILDISDPHLPKELDRYDKISTPSYLSATSILIADSVAYIIDGFRLSILNISDPIGAYELSSYKMTALGRANRVKVVGTKAYITSDDSFDIIDLSEPSIPREVGQYQLGRIYQNLPVIPYDFEISGQNAYILTSKGLEIVDISDSAAPIKAGYYQLPGNSPNNPKQRGLVVSGDYAYVALLDKGLRIINISNSGSPFEAGTYNPQNKTIDSVFVSNNYAYVSSNDAWGDLQILDISNPTKPLLVGDYKTPNNYIRGFSISNTNLLLEEGYGDNSNVLVLDVTNPTLPVQIGQCGQIANISGSILDNTYAYIGLIDKGWAIYDVSNPTTCHPIYRYSMYHMFGHYITWITVVGNLVLTADQAGGLWIFNVSKFSILYLPIIER